MKLRRSIPDNRDKRGGLIPSTLFAFSAGLIALGVTPSALPHNHFQNNTPGNGGTPLVLASTKKSPERTSDTQTSKNSGSNQKAKDTDNGKDSPSEGTKKGSSGADGGQKSSENQKKPDGESTPSKDMKETTREENVLISGGTLYYDDYVSVLPDDNDTYLIKWDKDKKILNTSLSYINVQNDVVYYRDNADRKFYSFNLKTKKTFYVIEDNVGEVFVANRRIYYTDLKDGRIYSTKLDGSDKNSVTEYPCNTFIVDDEDIYIIDSKQRFGIHSLSSKDAKQFDDITSPVERFYLGDDCIYIEAGSEVYKLGLETEEAELVYKSKAKDMRLVGVSSKGLLFVQEDGKLKLVKDGKPTELVNSKHTLYTSLSLDDKGTCRVIALTDADGESPHYELLTIANAIKDKKK